VASGSISRETALERLVEPLYEEDELRRDRQYICRKLRISDAELDELIACPIHHYTDFDNWDRQRAMMKSVRDVVARISGKRINPYS
jgi:hypothetical protein